MTIMNLINNLGVPQDDLNVVLNALNKGQYYMNPLRAQAQQQVAGGALSHAMQNMG